MKMTKLILCKKEDAAIQTQKATTTTTTTGAKTTAAATTTTTTTTTKYANEEKTSNWQYRSPNKSESKVSKVFFRLYDLNYDLNFFFSNKMATYKIKAEITFGEYLKYGDSRVNIKFFCSRYSF